MITLSGCSTLKRENLNGLSHQNANIYYNNELCARISAVELAYDNRRVVQEVTYIIEDPKFNHLAKPIIAYVSKHKPDWEVEVELKYYDTVYR